MSVDCTIADYYARRAREYERIYAKPERQAELPLLRAMVEQTFAGRHVLEIACGTGYWTQILARTAASIRAIDVNEEVLTIARGKPLDLQKVAFERANVYALPRFEQSFNGCLAAFWWSHVPKVRLRNFLKQLHAQLEPGATVVFIDNVYVEGSSTPVSHRDADGNTYQHRPLDDGSTHEVLKNFPTADELRESVAGLAWPVEVKCLTYFWSMSYVPQANA